MKRLATFAMAASLVWTSHTGFALPPPKDPFVSVIGLIGDRAILRINGVQATVKRGETRDGVTLVDIVAGEAVLKVNNRELHLGMGMDTGGIAAREAGPSVEIGMNDQGMFITNGMINGHVVEFMVDTGANTVSMTAEDARALGIEYRLDGDERHNATANGAVRAWGVTLRSVSVGPITVKNVRASVREAPRNLPILLGMSFLSHVNLQNEKNRLKMTAR